MLFYNYKQFFVMSASIIAMHSLLHIVTDIGDGACLLALTLISSIYLISRSARRAAAFLVASLVISAALISLLKIIFLSCHVHFYYFDILSPSGHAANSAAVFWAAAILMRSQLPPQRRFMPLLLLTLLIGAISYSRILLDFHSNAEVCIGLATGLLSVGLAYFFILRGRSPGTFDAYVFALWALVAVIVMHGTHLPAEDMLHTIASHVKNHVSFCSNIFK